MPTATSFACQTGYFRAEPLEGHRDRVRDILASGGEFHLVVGANEDRLVADDLLRVVEIIEPWLGTSAHFALVGFSTGVFHPKVFCCDLADGTRHALIGSANFTTNGMEHNVEACLAIDDADDAATVEDARMAILRWFEPSTSDLVEILDRDKIRDLAALRVVEPSKYSAPARSREQRGRKSDLPSLPRMFAKAKVSTRPPSSTPAIGGLPGAAAFPANAVGIVKILSPKQDVKGFHGRSGTPYIALPSDLGPHLPMVPMGTNLEPRMDVAIEARLDSALNHPVQSGIDSTNVTWVGKGAVKKSHTDLRLNILQTLTRGLLYVSSTAVVPIPAGGDLLAIEFLDEGRFVRLTFVANDPLRTALLALCTNGSPPGSGWGWLPAGVLPPWPA